MLKEIAADSQPMGTAAMTEAERHRVVFEWNQTARDYPRDKCLHQLIEAQSAQTPDWLAVIHGSEQLTYGEFNARANQLANYLSTRGIGRGSHVGICLEPSLEFAVAVLGVLKSGAACVPLDPNYPQERLSYMLQDVGARLVITQKGLLPSPSCELFLFDEQAETLASQPDTTVESGATPDDTAYVIYTSGSTGKPRGVLLSHAGLVNYNYHAARLYGMTQKDRVLQFCSVSFDIAIEELFITWLSGATLVLRTDDMPLAVPEFMDWIEQRQISVLDLPTAYWHEWVHELGELKRPSPENLRLVIVGGEKPSSQAYAKWFEAVGRRVRKP